MPLASSSEEPSKFHRAILRFCPQSARTSHRLSLTFDRPYGIVTEMEENLSSIASPVVERQFPAALDAQMSVGQALELLRGVPGESMPVLHPETGEVVGVLSSRLPEPLPVKPPRLGGMATPLGVYLTDGVSSGGAGFWGLFLSGVTLGALGIIAQAIVQSGWQLMAFHAPGLAAAMTVHSPGALRAWVGQMESGVWPTLLIIGLLLALLRCLPMAGTHAAEHQVVHCIERGAPLRVDCVRSMPRVHPRCGTNLVIGYTLFQTTFLAAWSAGLCAGWASVDSAALAIFCATPVTLLYWRRVGGFVQYWLATRPATDKQIASGIAAAHQVLAKRSEERYLPPSRFRLAQRVWKMGLAQVFAGYAALFGLLMALDHVWPRLGAMIGL